MRGSSWTGAVAIGVLALSGGSCGRPSLTRADAGVSRPLPAPTVKQPAAPTALPVARDDGCKPYWTWVDLGCDASAVQARWSSPPRLCDPVHERTTRSILMAAGLGDGDPREPLTSEYLRGVLWNDDPAGQLLSAQGDATEGRAWCQSFVKEQARARAGQPPGSLLGRSQFGDLQILHGLAPKPGQTALESYKKIIPWVEFTYRVGSGDIPGATKIGEVSVEGLSAMLPEWRKRTVNELFGVQARGDVKARALGSLLHLLQDMLGEGHAALVGQGPGPRHIAHYFTYQHGENALHRADPGWREAWTDDAQLAHWPGFDQAVQRGVDVLRLASRHQPWPVAKKFLDDLCFSYVSFDAPSVEWSSSPSQP
jgi:hypothetical protein